VNEDTLFNFDIHYSVRFWQIEWIHG